MDERRPFREFGEAWRRFERDPKLYDCVLPQGDRPYLVWLVRLWPTPGVERVRDLLGERRRKLPDGWLHMTVREVGFTDTLTPAAILPQSRLSLGPPNVFWDSVVLEVHGSGLTAPYRLPHVTVLYNESDVEDWELCRELGAARNDWIADVIEIEAVELVAVDVSREFGEWETRERISLPGG